MTPQMFLARAVEAAHTGGHIFPEHAACEAALESAWGSSELAMRANNLFGQKQPHPPRGRVLTLPTQERLHGEWVTVTANWMWFEDWSSCFAERMGLLRKLATHWPHYHEALSAGSGTAFVVAVSKSWSTDPERAEKVLAIFRAHFPQQAAPVPLRTA